MQSPVILEEGTKLI